MLCTASFWTPSASAQTPPPDVAAAADVDKQGRLCFTPKALAKVLYQFEECKLKLKLANEKWEDDQDAIEDVCRAKINATEQWCSGKVELVQHAYMEQVKIASTHCGELVSELTENCAEQVRTAARMAPKHTKPKIWEKAEFWGPMGAVLGLAAGIGLTYGIMQLK